MLSLTKQNNDKYKIPSPQYKQAAAPIKLNMNANIDESEASL